MVEIWRVLVKGKGVMEPLRILPNSNLYHISLVVYLLIAFASTVVQRPSLVERLKNELGQTESAKLSAASQEVQNYAIQKEGFQNTTQIESRQHLRQIRTIFDPTAARYSSVPLYVKIATLNISYFSEQQLSIPVFLRKLLI